MVIFNKYHYITFSLTPIFSVVFVLFYQEWKSRVELSETKKRTYDRRMELSVDRYRAGIGHAKWDKKKYAQWDEADRTEQQDSSQITFVQNVPTLVSSQQPRSRKKSVRELYEAGDGEQTNTLIGQLKGR